MAAMRTSEDATIVGDTSSNTSARRPNAAELDRRNILLGGQALAPSFLGTGTTMRPARRRKPRLPWASPTSSSSSATISARPISAPIRSAWWATHAQHRPHRQGRHDVHGLLRREQLHGGPLVLHHRPDAACAPAFRRSARPARRSGFRARHHDRRGSQAAWLRHRTIRQEPPRRQDEYLPTNHGFDEFFGNLYHLNAEEEPERPYWPKDDIQRPAS